jgi:hypothetical protein
MPKKQPFNITVPFNNKPDSGSQTFDSKTCKRSKFQIQTLFEISQRPDFESFYVCVDHKDNESLVSENYSCHFWAHFILKNNHHVMLDISRNSFVEIYRQSYELPYVHISLE